MGTAALARRTRALLVAVLSTSLLGLVAPSAVADDGTVPTAGGTTTSVTGRIVTSSARPLAGLPVSLCSTPSYTTEPAADCAVTLTASDGTFVFTDVPVDVEDPTYWTRAVRVHTTAAAVPDRSLAFVHSVSVDMRRGRPSTGDIVVPASPVIRGTVVDEAGPVRGAVVNLRNRPAWDDSPATDEVVTDSAGRFEIRSPHLPAYPGQRTNLEISADDHVSTPVSVVVEGDGVHDVGSQVMPLDRSVTATFTSDATIAGGLTAEVTGPRGSVTARTTATGIHVGALGNGDFTLAINDTEKGFYLEPVRFTLSNTVKHAELAVRVLPYATATAVVRTPDGRPVDGGWFVLERQEQGRWVHTADAHVTAGGARMPHLRAGTYRLVPSDSRTAAPLPSATGFTVAAGESRDLGVLTVEPFAMGYRHDVAITTPDIERTRVYDPDLLSVITASVISAAPMEGAEAVVLDGAGREVTSTLVTNGKLRFLMTRGAVGTHSGFRIHIPATYRSNAATSALVPPHTVTLRPTRVSAPRLSRSTVSRGGVLEVEVDVTHGDHGTLELLIDGKVAERTSMIPQGPGTTHTHLLMAPAPAVGKHTIAVRRVATATEAAATSATATLTVTKAALRGKPKVSTKTFRAGTKPTVTVTVPQTKHRAYATGKVRLYVGKKLVRTVTLKAKHRGRITTTLPLRPTKAIKVRAVYAGSKDVAGATSKVTTIKAKPKVRR